MLWEICKIGPEFHTNVDGFWCKIAVWISDPVILASTNNAFGTKPLKTAFLADHGWFFGV